MIATTFAPSSDVNSVVAASVVTTADVAMLLPGNSDEIEITVDYKHVRPRYNSEHSSLRCLRSFKSVQVLRTKSIIQI